MKRVAAVQMDVAFGEVDKNAEQVIARIHRVKADGVDLAVFPECVLTGYCYNSRDEALSNALPIDDPLFQRIAAACGESALHVVVGFLERDGDRLFNAQALISEQGVVATYRKIHLPGLGVDRFADPGDRDFEVHAAGKFVSVWQFATTVRSRKHRVLGLMQADVIALSTNWPVAARRTAEIVPTARSMENHLYFVAANRIGYERTFQFCGMSSIAGPDGIVLAETQADDDIILTADIDLSIARNKQIIRTIGAHVIDRFADRRPERYQMIADLKR
ncbi:MAG: carbon-nitrogen hydrolase family protein [Pirellulaceae bacterium]